MARGKKLTTDEVAERIFNDTNDDYELIGEYVNDKTKIKVRHISCGNEYYVRASHFFAGRRCKKHMNEKSPEKFLEQAYKAPNGDEYEWLEPYHRTHEPILVKHLMCGYEYKVTPDGFLSAGNRCPMCNMSTGEKKVQKILDELGVDYKIQYVFDDLAGKDNKVMPFDFYIESHNLVIEYDGRHHSIPIEEFGGNEYLKLIKSRDAKKETYLKSHNIKLLRIDFKSSDKELKDLVVNAVKNS